MCSCPWRLQELVDLQTEQKRVDIHRGRTGITPQAIKHYCEHVFQHWRLQGLVDMGYT
jgi:hypothetical protein